jgi:hypothetical protein
MSPILRRATLPMQLHCCTYISLAHMYLYHPPPRLILVPPTAILESPRLGRGDQREILSEGYQLFLQPLLVRGGPARTNA